MRWCQTGILGFGLYTPNPYSLTPWAAVIAFFTGFCLVWICHNREVPMAITDTLLWPFSNFMLSFIRCSDQNCIQESKGGTQHGFLKGKHFTFCFWFLMFFLVNDALRTTSSSDPSSRCNPDCPLVEVIVLASYVGILLRPPRADKRVKSF